MLAALIALVSNKMPPPLTSLAVNFLLQSCGTGYQQVIPPAQPSPSSKLRANEAPVCEPCGVFSLSLCRAKITILEAGLRARKLVNPFLRGCHLQHRVHPSITTRHYYRPIWDASYFAFVRGDVSAAVSGYPILYILQSHLREKEIQTLPFIYL
jgi:hypothetical protein